ncbi:uncharacterized protein LOC116256177 [Nymphaea colorata]|nr:uncharacterized protein LOC116256177 [Nymphaea colorata]
MASGKGLGEKFRRALRTLYFMAALLTSLLLCSATVLAAVADVLVSSALLLVFAGGNLRSQFERYGFRHSFVDVSIISVIRSLIVLCVYSLCDAPGLSHGPYVGTAVLCSLSSILILSVKACLFRPIQEGESEGMSSPEAFVVQRKLHLKQSWGMPALFMSSMVFALGHVVVAYRTSCRARRKLPFHRIDQEAGFGFSGHLKVPRSPTPTTGKNSRIDVEAKRRVATATAATSAAREEGHLSVKLLADVDSLFITYQGLTIHYKISDGDSPVFPSLATGAFPEHHPEFNSPNVVTGRLKLDGPSLSVPSKTFHLNRSFSNVSDRDSLRAPLLTAAASGRLYSDDITILGVKHHDKEMSFCSAKNGNLQKVANGVCGIVLVHGFGGGVFSWRHVMGPLARQTKCVVSAFDRPGWGLTSRPRKSDWEVNQLPNPYHLESQVDLLLHFCLEMGFSSVVLVGHDDGGLLALKAAERARTCSRFMQVVIKGIVLLNVSLSRDVVPSFARILLRTSLGKKHMVRPLLRAEINQVINRQAWYDARKMTPAVLNLYKAPLCIEGWDEAFQEIGTSFASTLSLQNASLLLEAVGNLPVLVVAGAKDRLVPLKSSQTLALKLMNSRLVAISGCGHLPHEECPNALLAALSPFINGLLCDLTEDSVIQQFP